MPNGHKYYKEGPFGSTVSDMEDAVYFNFAIKNLKEEAERMRSSDIPFQLMLAHIYVLLHLSKEFVISSQLLIKTEDVVDWQSAFDDWYEKCNKKIPAKFRQDVLDTSKKLFKDLMKRSRR